PVFSFDRRRRPLRVYRANGGNRTRRAAVPARRASTASSPRDRVEPRFDHVTRCRPAVKMAIAGVLLLSASIAHGQVYKCQDGTGKTIYADAPCAAGGKPLRLPNDAKGSMTDATVCAQLLDETRRLAAEADRDARRGRTPS